MQNLTSNISSGISGMFEKSLTDLVKGIRANKNNEEQFIRMCIQECKNELKQQDIKKKTNAIQKLTYVCFIEYFSNG
jgi:AP-3 complex subunit delta-1